MTVKIFIGNISDGAKSRDLQVLFERFGKVAECDILKNFGFVHMEVEEDAKAAIAALDGHSFSGSKITVEMSHGKSKRRSSGGPGGRGGGRPRGYGPPRSRYPPRDSYSSYDRSNGRYPPPPRSRYDPYDRRPPPPHPMDRRPPPPPPGREYYKDRSPYARPPPDYYSRRSPPPRSYYDHYDSARRSNGHSGGPTPSHAPRSPP